MRYIKTNEELFNKAEIPRDIIDDIVRSIRSKYQSVTVSTSDTQLLKDSNIYDRVTITTETSIGDIDFVITLRKPNNLNKVKIISKIKRALSDYSIDTVFYFNKKWEVRNTFTPKKFKDIDVTSVVNSIDWIVTKSTMMDKEKKETEKFYTEITISDIKDMLGDIYDILGEYVVKKTSINGKRGYVVEFHNAKSVIQTSNISGKALKHLVPSDNLSKVISEINVLNNRLKDVYNLRVIFDIHSSNVIILTIFQDKK